MLHVTREAVVALREFTLRCAAVLFMDGAIQYTDGLPAESIMQKFQHRKDNQITTLEILAISVGLSTFQSELQGRRVVVYSDNTGAEASVDKGSSTAWDQCMLIHEIWTLARARGFCVGGYLFVCCTQALRNRMHIWVDRVSSEENISDLPSRESYVHLEALGAKWRPPALASMFL